MEPDGSGGYREHAPPPALSSWLRCTWVRSGGEPPVRVVPDGCIDIVWTQGHGTQVVGPNTTAFVVPLDPGTQVVGVRMRPGAAPPLLGFDAAAVRDARAPVQELWGDAGRRLAEALDEREDRRAVLLALLTWRAARARRPDPLVAAAIARLRPSPAGAGGGPGVRAVADELGVSERQLRRRFTVAVGYGPKLLARVLRLEGALAAARDGEELARAAADAGYADQAHFANDCRALAGVSPSALLGRRDVRFLQDAAGWSRDRGRR